MFRVPAAAAVLTLAALAQTSPLTLAGAVASAWGHVPNIEAARSAAERAQADVHTASAIQFLPAAGVAGQWDRATDNAIPGLSFASPFPSISGTVPTKDYSGDSAWTSAAGAYFSWEVLDFGRRAANVAYYRDLAAQAGAHQELVRLQVGAHAADAYLTVLAAREQQRVATSDVDRWDQIARIIHALVNQQLRPGADASRADAEAAGARIRLANAQRNVAAAEANLVEALGGNRPLPPLAGLSPQPLAVAPLAALTGHPAAREQSDVILGVKARQQELARSALPRTFLLGSAYGRGSGVIAAGDLATGATGLSPTLAKNWAVGAGIDFSFTRWRVTKAQQASANLQLQQEQAQQRQVIESLSAAQRRAAADVAAAATVAQQSPIELAAAQTGEAQARVRYQTGLAGVVDLANAEQLLTQAESDQAVSQLQVWRAQLETAFANGDLAPLLSGNGGHS